MIVDSFSSRGKPTALTYLRKHYEGIDVRWVVATHWHNDHILGLEKILRAFPKAAFFCPPVTDSRELVRVVAGAEIARQKTRRRHGADVYGAVMRELAASSRVPNRVAARTLICRFPEIEVLGLSPTARAVDDGMASVARELLREPANNADAIARSPNLTSVALAIGTEEHCVLLGGDLEKHSKYGWGQVVAETDDVRKQQKSGLVKVPHHGGVSAHDQTMWDELVQVAPHAVVTPFAPQVPTDTDLARLTSLTHQLHVASSSSWASKHPLAIAVQRAIPGARRVRGSSDVGVVRYRATKAGWDVSTERL